MHYFLRIVLVLIFLFAVTPVYGAESKYINIVNPVRGEDFWELKEARPVTNVEKTWDLLKQKNLPATWLLRPDSLDDKEIISFAKNFPTNQELGLLMEVTPTWANLAGVMYNKSENWHSAASVFLTGYSVEARKKLIDSSFNKFKDSFGYYPKSVGAWWIDAGSLAYMRDQYGIVANLNVADQYSTDNYQVWGQYFSTPFYPSKRNALIPALGEDQKIGVVTIQWATRDPFNSYGNGVLDSTYSVQANDYANKKFHELDINYFKRLLAVYLDNPYSQLGAVTVGLENDFSWEEFGGEFGNQIEVVSQRRQSGALVLTMSDFARSYSRYSLSPPQVIFAEDPLGGDGLVVWYQTRSYRVGWFYSKEGSVIRDLRLFTNAPAEPCLDKPCNELNLAMAETRNIDEVTYGDRWIIDEGKISNFKLNPISDGWELTYTNQGGQKRTVAFVTNDIVIDGKPITIASAIAQVTSETKHQKIQYSFENKLENPLTVILKQLKDSIIFLIFAAFAFYLPGLVLVRKLDLTDRVRFALAWPLGISVFTLSAFILGYLHFFEGLFLLPLIAVFIIRKNLNLPKGSWITQNKLTTLLIIIGSISWLATTVKNGLIYDFGMGFWGAHGHDSFWHLSLIESIKNGLPFQNPIFAGENLTNYHYFYDLLLAAISFLTRLEALDLYFRFLPALLGVLIGAVTYVLANLWFNSKKAANLAVFFLYFGGSFGWVISYFKNKTLGGESLFWAQQGISTFINPPFAISLLLLLAGLILFYKLIEKKDKILSFVIPLTLLWGTLIEFKVYAGLLVLGALFIVTLVEIFKRNLGFLKISLPITLLALLVFLPNNIGSESLLLFSPLWLIHSMVDSPDRLGWYRLQLARMAGVESGNWLKFFAAEVIGLVVFVGGNLGTRIVGLFTIKKLLPLKTFNLFIFTFLVFALVIPLLFVQKGGPFNIVQFFYYFLVIFSFLAAAAVAKLKPILLVVIIALTIPTTWDTLHHYLPQRPPARISKEEIEALNFLKNQEDGIVLSFYDKKLRDRFSEPIPVLAYETTAYVSAFSGKNEFLSDMVNLEILGVDYKGRLQTVKDIASQREPEVINKLLGENNISYIYSSKIFNFIPNDRYNLEKIFENSEVEIFRVN